MIATLPVLAVTGLLAEARIAAGSGVVTLAGGGEAARLALSLEAALAKGARAVISFGIAGGLAPGLRPGTTVVARNVSDGATRFACDGAWREAIASTLPRSILADLVGVDQAVRGASAKAALREATGAAAVDMESHVAARLAARHGVPFAALRIIADPAERGLPLAATVGMRQDGSTDVAAVLRALLRHPGELPALIQTALDARAAFATLASNRRRLCSSLGFSLSGADRGWMGSPPRGPAEAMASFFPATPVAGNPGFEAVLAGDALTPDHQGSSRLSGSGVELPTKSA